MSYDPQEVLRQDEAREKRLHENIRNGEVVKRTLDSKGWKEFIGPLLDKMIIDVLGGKQKDCWTGGLVQKARKDERREYYIGYKQSLIDFHTRVRAYVDAIERSQDGLKELDKEKSKGFVSPMMEVEDEWKV